MEGRSLEKKNLVCRTGSLWKTVTFLQLLLFMGFKLQDRNSTP